MQNLAASAFYLEVGIFVSVLLKADAMVIHDVLGDGAAAVGGLGADCALVGALVPLVVLHRAEAEVEVVLTGPRLALQLDLRAGDNTRLFGLILRV